VARRLKYDPNRPETIRQAIRDAVRRSGISPQKLLGRDLVANGAGRVMQIYYHHNVFRALSDAGFAVERACWRRSRGHWGDPATRRRAIRGLVKEMGGPRNVRVKDLQARKLTGLFRYYDSLCDALRDAGYDVRPWELRGNSGIGYWSKGENRRLALEALLARTGKDPGEVRIADFKALGLLPLFDHYRRNRGLLGMERSVKGPSYIPMVQRAFLAEGLMRRHDYERAIQRLLMRTAEVSRKARTGRAVRGRRKVPDRSMKYFGINYWNSKKNRVRWVHWLVRKKGGCHKVVCKDLLDNHLGTLLQKNLSLHALLMEAGYDIDPWEMKASVPDGLWYVTSNRCRALTWMLERAGVEPEDVTQRTFIENRLIGLFDFYRKNPKVFRSGPAAGLRGRVTLAKRILLHEGFFTDVAAAEKADALHRRPGRYWQDRDRLIRAVQEYVNARGGPTGVTTTEMIRDGLKAALNRYKSLYALLKDAGYTFEPWKNGSRAPQGFWADPENRKRAIEYIINREGCGPDLLVQRDFMGKGLNGVLSYYRGHPDVLNGEYRGRLSSKTPLFKRILVREGFLKGDGLYGGAAPKGDKRRRAKGYERHWIPRKERPIRMKARRKVTPKTTGTRKGRTVWKVTKEKGKARIRNF